MMTSKFGVLAAAFALSGFAVAGMMACSDESAEKTGASAAAARPIDGPILVWSRDNDTYLARVDQNRIASLDTISLDAGVSQSPVDARGSTVLFQYDDFSMHHDLLVEARIEWNRTMPSPDSAPASPWLTTSSSR